MEGDDAKTILLIEDDDDTRPFLNQQLRTEGYRVLVAPDDARALKRIGDGLASAALILINQGKQPDDCIATGRRVRRQAGLGDDVPVVVLASTHGGDMEGKNVLVGAHVWVSYLVDGRQLPGLLARILRVDSS